jgi:hypothetical protein
MLRTIAILLALSTGAQVGQAFPNTNKYGRATIEYRHQGLGVVANYDYSQRITAAVAAHRRGARVHRSLCPSSHQFQADHTRRPDHPARQPTAGPADMENINLLIQNAKIHRQNLDTYFPQRNRLEAFNFFSLPFVRSISDEAIVDNDRVAQGPLLFQSQDGNWKEGTYRLVLTNDKAKAELPITLQ